MRISTGKTELQTKQSSHSPALGLGIGLRSTRRKKFSTAPARWTFFQIKEKAYSVGLQDLNVELPVSVIDEAAVYLRIPKGELMKILGLKPSSVSTWAKSPDGLLPPNESDRLARLARITGVVEQALENQEDAIDWLSTAVPALGSQKPVTLLGSDGGARLVENMLMRSLAGVYA
ncbi:MAG: antitoxin Xre/MbcA/ParS toxin-binding domain-containing protein [Pseudomonadota bacterium]